VVELYCKVTIGYNPRYEFEPTALTARAHEPWYLSLLRALMHCGDAANGGRGHDIVVVLSFPLECLNETCAQRRNDAADSPSGADLNDVAQALLAQSQTRASWSWPPAVWGKVRIHWRYDRSLSHFPAGRSTQCREPLKEKERYSGRWSTPSPAVSRSASC
jgi:hypothetical protein